MQADNDVKITFFQQRNMECNGISNQLKTLLRLIKICSNSFDPDHNIIFYDEVNKILAEHSILLN